MWRCDAFEGSCLPSKSAHLSCFCLLLALIFWPSVSKRKEKKRRHCSSQSNMCQIPCEGSLGHVKVLSSWTRSTTRVDCKSGHLFYPRAWLVKVNSHAKVRELQNQYQVRANWWGMSPTPCLRFYCLKNSNLSQCYNYSCE